MLSDTFIEIIVQILNDSKAKDIKVLDIQNLTDIADHIIICSASSTRHADALRNKIVKTTKSINQNLLSIEGSGNSGWVLIDLQDVIVHIMLSEVRNLYNLEKLWDVTKLKHNIESQ